METFLLNHHPERIGEWESLVALIHPSSLSQPMITTNDRESFLGFLNQHYQVMVIRDVENGKLAATLTLIMEPKSFHGYRKAARIEDLVVHPDYRNQGLATDLIRRAIEDADRNGCYKIVLECSDDLEGFYCRMGFERKGNQMDRRLG